MTLSDYKVIAEIFALVLGGAWAILGLIVLRQRERASAELRKFEIETKKTDTELQKLEIEIKKSEFELRHVAVIKADISTTQHTQSNGYLLFAEVTLNNVGNFETRLNWENTVFTIWRVIFDETGEAKYSINPIELTVKKSSNPNMEAKSHVVRAGGCERLSFAVRLTQPGVYFLSFRVLLDSNDMEVAKKAGVGSGSPHSWTANKYIIVGDEQKS